MEFRVSNCDGKERCPNTHTNISQTKENIRWYHEKFSLITEDFDKIRLAVDELEKKLDIDHKELIRKVNFAIAL